MWGWRSIGPDSNALAVQFCEQLKSIAFIIGISWRLWGLSSCSVGEGASRFDLSTIRG